MGSIFKSKRQKSNAREFQITASVAALKIECQKDTWHPEKLIITWDKDNTNCHTKPVPWQPGTNNALRGTHVWPEPDPVVITTKLYKNAQREGTYQDHPWNIVIKNETESGRRRVIATGCVDVADYISETMKSFDITVTLKPANRNIKSGSVEFTLTSVMLEDGIPYRKKEEILKEFLEDATKSASVSTKVNKRLHSDKETIPLEDLNTCPRLKGTVLPALPSSEDKNLEQSNAKESSSQAGAIDKADIDVNNNGVPKKAKRKAPPPPRPPPPTRHKTPAPNAPPAEENKEVKRSSPQSNGDEEEGNSANTSPPARQKQKKKTKKTKYPKEFNPFGRSSEDEDTSFSSQAASPSKNATEQKCEEEGTAKVPDRQGSGEEKCSYVPSKPAREKKRHGSRKTNKYPKVLNPFGGSSDEENDPEGTSISKGVLDKECVGGTTKVLALSADGEEKTAHTDVPSPPGRRKNRRKARKSNKYPKALNPFGGSSDEDNDLEGTSTSKGTPDKECEGRTTKVPVLSADGEEKTAHTDVPSPPGRRKNRRKARKSNKYPKALNPFGGSSDEDAAKSSSKESEMSEGYTTKVTDEADGKVSLSDEKVLLNKATTCDTENTNKASVCDDSGASGCVEHPSSPEAVLLHENKSNNEELSVSCGAHGETEGAVQSETGISIEDGASGCDEHPSSPEAAVSQCENKVKEGGVQSGDIETGINLEDGASGCDEHPSLPDAVLQCENTEVESEQLSVNSGVNCQKKTEGAVPCGAAVAAASDDGDSVREEHPSSPDAVSKCENTEVESEQLSVNSGDNSQKKAEGAVPCGAAATAPSDDGDSVRDERGISNDSGCTDSAQHEAAANGTDENSHGTTPDNTDSAATEKEKQNLPCFNDKLPMHPTPKVPARKKKGPPRPSPPSRLTKTLTGSSQTKETQHCPDLSAYVTEEMKLLHVELDSINKVIIKLEQQMCKTRKVKENKEELNGLIKDWLSLTDYQEQLDSRRRDLEILDKQEDLDLCWKILRSEMKLLVEMEDWRKNDSMRVQESKLVDIVLSFSNKRREN